MQRLVVHGWIFGLLGALAAEARAATNLPPSDPRARARVVIIEDNRATVAFNTQEEIIRKMVEAGVTRVTGEKAPGDAWRKLVSPQDRVGLKVASTPGQYSGTRPAVVAAVAEGLIAAGVPATNIVIWDRNLVDLRLAGYFDLAGRLGVRVAASLDKGYDEKRFYDTPLLGRLVFGDHEFGKTGEGIGRKSFVSKLVTREMTKIINITPMLNHNVTGVSGHLWSLALGSVDNILRFEADEDRLFTAIPEIYALPVLGDRVALNITDALVCQYEGGEHGLLHYSTTLNELRFSTDAVALDVLSVRELERQRKPPRPAVTEKFMELYRNAALVEIGVCEQQRIHIERVNLNGQ